MGRARCSERERLKRIEDRQKLAFNLAKLALIVIVAGYMMLHFGDYITYLDNINTDTLHMIAWAVGMLGYIGVLYAMLHYGLRSLED